MIEKAISMTYRSRLQNRVELLGTCAMIAATIAIAHSNESFAQTVPAAFQGTPSVAAGSASISRGGPSGSATAVDTISLNTQSTIINWNTFDRTTNATIDFLPNNTVGTFQSFQQNFTVLNRVFAATPGQAISINGTVLAQNFRGQSTGNVWFYSPGGIIAGSTSVFNVGNLILTADDIDTTGGLFGLNNTIRFRGATGSTSAITVQPGAQFNLPGAGSYLALVAPQVIMGGTATINGSTAYIAAEQVDIRINGGAFDIAFITGTGVANALIHSGTTTGPAAANGTIVMAAMPKNTAITLLVGGAVGYTPAATATVQNGTVVLSAGQDVVLGTISQTPSLTAANLTIGSGTFSSQVSAQATTILASPDGNGPLAFIGNATLAGLNSVEVRADAGETVTSGGDLTLVSRRAGVGGTARLIADGAGSSISVGGVTQIDASAVGASNFAGAGGDAIGGTAEIVARQGTVIVGPATVLANGSGGFGTTQSGNGIGGIARVHAEQSRGVNILTGDLSISAVGQGGQGGGQFPASPIGGNGVGGQALYEVANQGFAQTGALTITANASGGAGGSSGGNASAGTAQISVGTGALNAQLTRLSADEQAGFAGVSGTTGSTFGNGLARIQTQAGTVQLNGLVLSADAWTAGADIPQAAAPATEGALTAGTVEVNANLGGIFVSGGPISASANAFGTGTSFATSAGAVKGGVVNLFVANAGTIWSNGINAQVNAAGTSTSATAGNATAGQITVSLSGNASLHLDNDDSKHDIVLTARALDASGAAPASANGGQISVSFGQGRTQGIAMLNADATGFAGSSTTGGSGTSGQGGSVTFSILPGADVSADGVALRADGASIAEVGSFVVGPGAGSSGTGGAIAVDLTGGLFTTSSLSVSASGRGANGFAVSRQPGTISGIGVGGTATFTIDGTTANIASVSVEALGIGGFGGNGLAEISTASSAGADGTGGSATLQLSSGILNADRVQLSANGIGGNGGSGDGVDGAAAGSGTGGSATFRNLANSIIGTSAITVSATGHGGYGGGSSFNGSELAGLNGGDSGAGIGGTALIDWQGQLSAQTLVPPSLVASSGGEGFNGGAGYDAQTVQSGTFGGQGGDSRGGSSTILISGLSTQFYYIDADAGSTGGSGANGNATRRGGDAKGGTAQVRVIDAPLVVGSLIINSSAQAGQTQSGSYGAGPRGSDASGGTSSLEVDGKNGTYIASNGGQYAYGGTPILSLSANANATDGVGGANGTTGSNGGRGGNAIGGKVSIQVIDGSIDISPPTNLGLYVNTLGGNAGNGGNAASYQPTGGGAGGDAGAAIGGIITLSAAGGHLALGTISLAANATAGSAGYGGSDAGRPAIPGTQASPGVPATPPAFGANGMKSFGVGGTINIQSQTSASGADGLVSAGDVSINVGASTNGFGNVGNAGVVSVANINSGGGALRLGSLTVNAGSMNNNFVSGTTTLIADHSPINVDGDVQVIGPTNAYVQTSGIGSVTAGGNIDVKVRGYIGINQFGGSGQPALAATTVTAAGDNGVSAQTALIRADTDITLSSALGSITTGGLTAGRNIGVTTNSGDIMLGAIVSGGNATIEAPPSTSLITVAQATVGGFLQARGGAIRFGNITAGTDAILSAFNGSLTVGNVTAGDDIFLTVNGSAANPNVISPDSQTGTGGTTAFALVAGDLRSTGLGSDTAASGPATFTDAGPTGNVIRVRSSGAAQTGSISTAGYAILLSDSGSVAAGNVNALAGVGVFARTDATLADITTNGTFWLGDSSQYFLVVPTYQITNFPFSQTPTAGTATLGTVNAGLIRGSTTGDLTFNKMATTSDILWRTGNSNTVGGSIIGNGVSSGASLTLVAGGNLSFTDATAQLSALLISQAGSVTGNSVRSTGDAVDADGRLGVNIGTIATPVRATLDASNGNIWVAGNLTAGDVVAGGQNIVLVSSGIITATSLQASGGNIDVSASNGLSVINGNATGNMTLSTHGTAALTSIRSGLDTSVTAREIDVENGAYAGRALQFDATGLISINDNVNAGSIAFRSGDINIGGESSVGTLGFTRQLSFTNTANTKTFIGGADNSGGYSLSSAEIGRLAAENISVVVSPQRQDSNGQMPLALTPNIAPDLILDNLAIAGAQNLGPKGTFLVETPGKMRVIGTVALNGMTANNRVDLRAATAIEVLPTGSITIQNSEGVTGTLTMAAEDIIASSSAALTDVSAATTLTAASDRLGANDATSNESGFFQAGGIIVTVSKGIYVQNTGSSTTMGNRDFAMRRGFTVGANGFTIVQASSAPVRLAINGRQVITAASTTGSPTASGFTTGIDVVPLIKFVPFGQQSSTPFSVSATGATAAQQQQAATIFDPLSTVNGCSIVSAPSCQNTPLNDPTRDVLDGKFGEKAVARLLPLSIIQLKDYSAAGNEPLIDEPVTGAGNDDLWSVDDSKSCDPVKQACK